MSVSRRPMNGPPRSQQGFTLLELIIALVIFAIMAVMAYGGLDQINLASRHTETAMARLASVQRAVSLMQTDFEQFRPRPIRDEFGDPQPALKTNDAFEKIAVHFTRGGQINQAGGMLRVGYGVEDDILYRYQWNALDRAQNSEPLQQPILENVEQMTMQFIDAEGEAQDVWPPAEVTAGLQQSGQSGGQQTGQSAGQTNATANANPLTMLPIATVIELELKDYGVIRRVFHGVY